MSETYARRPEDLRFLSGIILVSRDPARLVGFYRDLLGVRLTEERHDESALHWACEVGDIHFAIHPADEYPDEAVTPGAIRIAFMVFDLNSLVTWLTAAGVELVYPPVEFGTESRITAVRDPDGNLVELTELGPVWLDHLRANRAEGGDIVAHWAARA